MKRAQQALQENGNVTLHKIDSNSTEAMQAFPADDLAKDLAVLDLSKDDLPIQRSLGLCWNLGEDTFTFQVSDALKPFTRRGVLSTVMMMMSSSLTTHQPMRVICIKMFN